MRERGSERPIEEPGDRLVRVGFLDSRQTSLFSLGRIGLTSEVGLTDVTSRDVGIT